MSAPRGASPDLEDVGRIVTITDPLERNAAITRGYHALSEAVAGLLGRRHANWLTFGQWASAEARRSIDGESVPAAMRPLFGVEIATAVAAGNAAIFGDVAPPFVRFLAAMVPIAADVTGATDPRARARDHAELDRRLAGALRAITWDPQVAASEDLTRAFTAYTDALRLRLTGEDGGPRFAARVLVANASIGAHEQRVADPYVRAAIPGRWITAIAATMHMGIHIPEGVLELSRDVPPPAYLGGAMFPPDLVVLEDPEALALAMRFGQASDSAARSDAPDWESYEERMGFIFTLLRSHQCDPALFALPPDTPNPDAAHRDVPPIG